MGYADYVKQIEGSATLAAVLNDDRLTDEFKAQLAARAASTDEQYPSLRGYTREASQLQTLTEYTAMILAAIKRNAGIKAPPRPQYPADRIEQEQVDEQFDSLMADIFKANPTVFGVNGGGVT